MSLKSRGFNPHNCTSKSMLVVEGKPYCMFHARIVLLDMVMEINRKQENKR